MLGASAQGFVLHGWWQPVESCQPSNTCCSGPWLHIGSRTAIERLKKHAWYYGTTTEFCRCDNSFVFANSETETCKDSCITHFPTIPPCSTKVDVLETGDVPILCSLSQMKNLGRRLETGSNPILPRSAPVRVSKLSVTRLIHPCRNNKTQSGSSAVAKCDGLTDAVAERNSVE